MSRKQSSYKVSLKEITTHFSLPLLLDTNKKVEPLNVKQYFTSGTFELGFIVG